MVTRYIKDAFLHGAGDSVVGQVRKANEDNCGYSKTVNGELFVVCDGMGGHVGGATASRIAVDSILSFIGQQAYEDKRVALDGALKFANTQIMGAATQDPSLKGMGTTACIVLVDSTNIWIAHVGDSRIYLYSEQEKYLYRITKDHSLVQGLVDHGELDDREAEHHPQKNIILRALGTKQDVQPEVDKVPVRAQVGDTFLICSDGLSGMLDDNQIEAILREDRSLEDKVQKLIDLANTPDKGKDNITVQLVQVLSSPDNVSVHPDYNPKWRSAGTTTTKELTRPVHPVEAEAPRPKVKSKKKKTLPVLLYTSLGVLLFAVSMGIMFFATDMFRGTGEETNNPPKVITPTTPGISAEDAEKKAEEALKGITDANVKIAKALENAEKQRDIAKSANAKVLKYKAQAEEAQHDADKALDEAKNAPTAAAAKAAAQKAQRALEKAEKNYLKADTEKAEAGSAKILANSYANAAEAVDMKAKGTTKARQAAKAAEKASKEAENAYKAAQDAYTAASVAYQAASSEAERKVAKERDEAMTQANEGYTAAEKAFEAAQKAAKDAQKALADVEKIKTEEDKRKVIEDANAALNAADEAQKDAIKAKTTAEQAFRKAEAAEATDAKTKSTAAQTKVGEAMGQVTKAIKDANAAIEQAKIKQIQPPSTPAPTEGDPVVEDVEKSKAEKKEPLTIYYEEDLYVKGKKNTQTTECNFGDKVFTNKGLDPKTAYDLEWTSSDSTTVEPTINSQNRLRGLRRIKKGDAKLYGVDKATGDTLYIINVHIK